MGLSISDAVVKRPIEALARTKEALPEKPPMVLAKAISGASEILIGMEKIFKLIKCIYENTHTEGKEGVFLLGCGNWRLTVIGDSVILGRLDPSYFIILNTKDHTLSVKSRDLEVRIDGTSLYIIKGGSVIEISLNNVEDIEEKSMIFNALSRYVKMMIATTYDKLLKCVKVLGIPCEGI